MIETPVPDWLDNILRGAPSPKPPPLNSDRVKQLVRRGLLAPDTMSRAEIRELSAAVISHLVEQKG